MSNHPYTKFVIVCSHRTGSTFLTSKLNSHDHIVCYSEMFDTTAEDKIFFDDDQLPYLRYSVKEVSRMRYEAPVSFLQRIIFQDYPATIHAVGFKFHYAHAENFASVLRALVDDRSIKVLHLKRRNMLDSYISLKKARQTKMWVNFSDRRDTQSDQVSLVIDHDRCKYYFEQMENRWKVFDDLFRHHCVLPIDYELLTAGKVDREVLAFLAVSDNTLHSPLLKHPYAAHSRCIKNYAQLRERFKDTKWAEFFKDEM